MTRNYAEKSINNILDYVGGEGKASSDGPGRPTADNQHAALAPQVPLDTLEEYYEATRIACDEAKNEVSSFTLGAHRKLTRSAVVHQV